VQGGCVIIQMVSFLDCAWQATLGRRHMPDGDVFPPRDPERFLVDVHHAVGRGDAPDNACHFDTHIRYRRAGPNVQFQRGSGIG